MMSGVMPTSNVPRPVDIPEGSYRWLDSNDADAEVGAPDKGYLREGYGDYEDLSRIIAKHNGYRPGPVRGWYVIAKLDGSSGFVVGQMRADAGCPIQLFSDQIFPTEEAARQRAEQMRSNQPGVMRKPNYPVVRKVD